VIAERGGGASGLHNMSAPPRSTIAVKPLRCGQDAKASESGLVLVGRFDLAHAWASVLKADVFLRLAAGGDRMLLTRSQGLLVSLMLARAVDGDLRDADDTNASAASSDAMEDELLGRIANWEHLSLGLPCIAFIEETSDRPDAFCSHVPLDPSPARTLHVLAHRRGRLYLRDEAPIGFDCGAVLRRYLLLVPQVGGAS
jgi:hypothetical protein